MKPNFDHTLFEQEAEKFTEKHQIPGANLGINYQGKPLYYHGFGYRNKAKQLPLDKDTIFGIASMTKSFAAVAIMQLQDAGKLSVHDQVIQHAPEFKLPSGGKTDEVTIHHLLTHTSGLPPIAVHNLARKRSIDQDPTAKDYGLDVTKITGDSVDTDTELMEALGALPDQVLADPGEAFSYSNEGYGVLGAIVKRVSGVSFETFVEENILKPVKMSRSFFDVSEIESRDNVTMLYAQKRKNDKKIVYETPLWWDAPAMRAGGYLKSTVKEILAYLEIFRNKGVVNGVRILSEASVAEMTEPHVEFEPGRYYGYGLRVIPDYYGYKMIEHSGGLKGVSSHMTVVPERGLTGVVLTNLSDVPAATLLKGAMNVLFEKDFTTSHLTYETYSMDQAKLPICVGTYTSTEGMRVEIALENGKLGVVRDGKFAPLQAIGEYIFLTETNDVVKFIVDKKQGNVRIGYGSRQIAKDE